jgi:peptidoglycan/xylan/chitin deacetylase (PgdA/CDA1 family)
MRAHVNSVPVLAYHSISREGGPTSIAPETFRMQMDVLVECGFASMTCGDFLDWHSGRDAAATSRALITFDDAYADFASEAFPILRERSFSSIVFVPTGKVGQREDWRGAHPAARALMTWSTLRDLAAAGVEFGGHGVSHADLTRLTPELRRREIDHCAQELAARIERPVRSFAAPYGHVNRAVLADIARTYEVAFGTRLERVFPTRDRFDVPRIEMHYFRDARRWRDFILGEESYFRVRRALRRVRAAASQVLPRGNSD